jgi:hypothetical protein
MFLDGLRHLGLGLGRCVLRIFGACFLLWLHRLALPMCGCRRLRDLGWLGAVLRVVLLFLVLHLGGRHRGIVLAWLLV